MTRRALVLIAPLLLACGKREPRLERQLPAPDAGAPITATAEDTAATPGGDTAPTTPTALDRSVRPAPRPIAELELPKVERFTLANGLEVFLLGNATLPVVSMTLEVDVGAAYDPPDKIGLASVCLDLFSEGTERLDKVAWSEALADHAVSIYSPAGSETSTVVMRTLTSELEPALDLLSELLRSPGMRQADFDRIIADRKAALAQSRGTAQGIAGRLFASLVWGQGHPYGAVQVDAHIDAISLADCKAWVGQLRPGGARLWVAGRIERGALTSALESRLATWTGAAPVPPSLPAAPAPSGTIFAVQVDGAVQSMVLVGHPGPARTADDYEATFLMGQIFGGSFSSRINMNLREDKGYAYGSRGQFNYRKAGGAFTVSASVETSTTALSLREIAKELGKMRSEAPSEAELVRERDGALLALPARFAKAGNTLDELRGLALFGLPLDWHAGYQKRLAAVGVDAIKAAAEAHLAPGDVVVLVVGDLTKEAKDAGGKTVRDELDKLAADKVFGAGGLVLLDADGKRL